MWTARRPSHRGNFKLHQCIYCLTWKPLASFSKEHVVQASMIGKTREPLVLRANDGIVCLACNQAFDRAFDRKLARDTPEGFSRVYEGLIGAEEFKTFGKKSSVRAEVKAGKLAGKQVWVSPQPMPSQFALHEIVEPCLRFTSGDVIRDYQPDAVLSHQQLRADGIDLRDGDKVELIGIEYELVAERLRGLGFEGPSGAPYPPEPFRMSAEVFFGVPPELLRCYAKIVFNYLAYVHGKRTALLDVFDDARAFILHGTQRAFPIVAPMQPLVLRRGQQEVRSIWLSVEHANGHVVGQVCFYGRIRWRVTLAAAPRILLHRVGHIYDLERWCVELTEEPPSPFFGEAVPGRRPAALTRSSGQA